ncbi:MAG: hypothetical protein ACU837_17280 [Gammaproteobacteria bacterium]
MKKTIKAPLAAAMGTAAVAMFATGTANAEANPFGMAELSNGYMQVAAAETTDAAPAQSGEAKSGEMACGAMMNKSSEMACGANMGGMKKEEMGKTQEGSCGGKKTQEGSCGAMMNNGK